MKDFTQKEYQKHIPCSDRFSKPIAVFRGKNAAYEFIKAIFEGYEYCKK